MARKSKGRRVSAAIGPFSGGLDNVQKETSIGPDSLSLAKNVDIADDGKIQKRKGRTQVYSGTNIHSIYSHNNLCVFVEGGTLKRLNHDWSATNIKTGLNSSTELDYVTVNGDTYYVSEGNTGKLSWDGSWTRWGVPAPKYQPSLIAATGGFSAGEYQVAVTFQDHDGNESGTVDAELVTLTDNQKIVLTGIPTDTDSQYVNVYASAADGEDLYFQMQLAAGTATADLSYFNDGHVLESQFFDAPPTGQFIAYYNGRIYIAQDNILYYTEPYAYDWIDYSKNYIQYPENIKFIKSLNNGVFVGSDQVYFLRGDDPTEVNQRVAFQCSPIYNTAVVVESTLFNFENIFGQAIFFWSDRGAMIGTEEGFVIPLSARKYVPDEYGWGKSFFRQEEGISSIISPLRQKGSISTLGATDAATATITRNGITIG